MSALQPNPGKELRIKTSYGDFERYPVKTKLVESGDSIPAILRESATPYVQDGDMIFISEKIIAISQGRAFDIDDIHPSKLATFLSKFVYKSPYGIGLGMPETMELALRDVGTPRILAAAFCSAITKPFGVRGVFYKIAGTGARAIDGPCDCTIPPYNHCAKLAPKDPDKVAALLEKETGCKIVIMDANDIGREILGRSDQNISIEMCKEIFADNPLGQGAQQTPVCIIRKV
ncbi:MAG: coenzyme F420-0:L-glutamate ligase [Clostridia bacterium]|nr:coenzyme F420-0:L-glutamate ligase [Clostridia bacterium]